MQKLVSKNRTSEKNFIFFTVIILLISNLAMGQDILTFDEFTSLSSNDQAEYLVFNNEPDLVVEYLYKTDFTNPNDAAIAERFFSENSANINNNRDIFIKYTRSEGINLMLDGDVISYSPDGFLQTFNGDINIKDFKEKYSYEVNAKGVLLLTDKLGSTYSFEGSIQTGKQGNINLNKGSINGIKVNKGRNLKLSGGIISGSVTNIAGVNFVGSAIISFDKSRNILSVNNGKIHSVDSKASIFLRGSAIINNYDNIKGDLSVLKGTKVRVNNFQISSQTDDVQLKFKSGFITDLLEVFKDSDVTYVKFADTVEVVGNVDVKVSEFDIRANKKVADSKSLSLLDRPSVKGRSWYKKGDRFSRDEPGYGQLVDLKKTLNSWHELNFNRPYFSDSEISGDVYDTETIELVKLFQQEYNAKFPGDKISDDGQWGRNTFDKYKKYSQNSLFDSKNFQITSRGGKTKIFFNSETATIEVDTAYGTIFTVGNKKFQGNGKDITKEISRSVAVSMDSDVEIKFRDVDGNVIDTVTAKADDYRMGRVQSDICLECALKNRVDFSKAHCAGFVQQELGIELVGSVLSKEKLVGDRTVMEAIGYSGSSWVMPHNIKGETLYKKEADLSEEDREVLFEVEKAVRNKFMELSAKGIQNKVIRRRLRDDDITRDFPAHLKKKYSGLNLRQLHNQLLGDTNQKFDVTKLQNNDLIGLYHRNSDYLGTASLNGKTRTNDELLETGAGVYSVDNSMGNNRHTHSGNGYWGATDGFVYDYSVAPQQSIKGFLKAKYALRNDNSLFQLGNIFVEDKSDGFLKTAKMSNDGQIYFASDLDSIGNPLPGKIRIVMNEDTKVEVQPYMVKHLDGRIHNEPLAKAIDHKNSLYLVKRPDAKHIQSVLDEAGVSEMTYNLQVSGKDQTVEQALRKINIPEENIESVAKFVRKVNGMQGNQLHSGDVVRIPVPEISSFSSILSITQRLREAGVKDPDLWAESIRKSTPSRLQEYNIPHIHTKDFEKITAGIINRESSFGQSKRYKFKAGVQKIIPEFVNPFGSKGYGQIDLGVAEGISNQHGERFDTKDLFTRDGSVKFTQRKLAEAFEIYAPTDRSLTNEEKRVIAITYNSGIMTPRNAAIQENLYDLDYIGQNIPTTGTVGPATISGLKKFAEDQDISLEGIDLEKVMGKSQRHDFESSKLYLRLKEVWRNKFIGEPPYATLPKYSTEKFYTGRITAGGYADSVVGFSDGVS